MFAFLSHPPFLKRSCTSRLGALVPYDLTQRSGRNNSVDHLSSYQLHGPAARWCMEGRLASMLSHLQRIHTALRYRLAFMSICITDMIAFDRLSHQGLLPTTAVGFPFFFLTAPSWTAIGGLPRQRTSSASMTLTATLIWTWGRHWFWVAYGSQDSLLGRAHSNRRLDCLLSFSLSSSYPPGPSSGVCPGRGLVRRDEFDSHIDRGATWVSSAVPSSSADSSPKADSSPEADFSPKADSFPGADFLSEPTRAGALIRSSFRPEPTSNLYQTCVHTHSSIRPPLRLNSIIHTKQQHDIPAASSAAKLLLVMVYTQI